MKKDKVEKRTKLSKTAIAVMVVVCVLIIAASFVFGGKTFSDFRNAYFGGNAEVADPTIKVGVYECLSGEYKQYGRDEAAGSYYTGGPLQSS